MELPLFIIYIIAWFWMTLKRKKVEGLYSVFFIFGLAGFAYFVLIPFEMYVRGEEYFFVQYWIRLGSYERNLILLMSVMALFGFYYGLKVSGYGFLPGTNYNQNTGGRGNEKLLWPLIRALFCVIFLCGSIMIIFYRDLVLSQWEYSAAYGITYESPLYSFVKTHFLISLALTAGLLRSSKWRWREKIVGFTIVILIVFIAILTADKGPLLIALLTCGSFIEFRKRSFRKFAMISLFGSIAVVIVVLFFNLYRTRIPFGEVLYNIPWSSISFTRLDPAGPMVTLVTVMSSDLPLEYGKTYIKELGVIIPRVIWPDRPLPLSEQFARDFIADYSEGRGIGYSPLAESFLNLHIPGAFIHFFVFGFLVGGFLRFLMEKVFIKKETFLVPFIYIVGYEIIIISFRSELIAPVKSLMMFMVPYCVLYILMILLRETARPIQRTLVLDRKSLRT